MSLFFPKGQVPDPIPKGSEKIPEMHEWHSLEITLYTLFKIVFIFMVFKCHIYHVGMRLTMFYFLNKKDLYLAVIN